MWPGPEGGGLEGGGDSNPHSYSLSLPEGVSMDSSHSSQRLQGLSEERVQKANLEDRKQAQSQVRHGPKELTYVSILKKILIITFCMCAGYEIETSSSPVSCKK